MLVCFMRIVYRWTGANAIDKLIWLDYSQIHGHVANGLWRGVQYPKSSLAKPELVAVLLGSSLSIEPLDVAPSFVVLLLFLKLGR